MERTAEACPDGSDLLRCDICCALGHPWVAIKSRVGPAGTGALVCVACVQALAAAAFPDIRDTLDAVREFLPTDEEQVSYGAFPGGDPREFSPDEECSTEAERAAHRAACDAWDRGEQIECVGGCEERDVEPGAEITAGAAAIRNGAATATVSAGHVRIAWQTFGLGTYTFRDPQVVEIRERIASAIRALGGE